MDYTRILRRSFEIVRSYRVLWIFGLILAFTGGRGNPQPNWNTSSRDFENNGNFNFPFEVPNWRGLPNWHFGTEVGNAILGTVIGLICLGILLSALFALLRYVSLNASIQMVDRYEASGQKLSFRESWRLGWSRGAWRLFLIDLVFGLGVALLFLLIFAVAALPLLLLTSRSEPLSILGVISSVGLFLLLALVMLVVGTALWLLGQFFHRAAVLENLGVFDAIRRGWAVARAHVKDAVIMGLILFGMSILASIVLIPVALVLVAIGAVLGGLPGFAIGMLVNQMASSTVLGVISGILVGLPVFLLVVALPMSFLYGLFEAYVSSTWTLTYRELTAAPPALAVEAA